MSQNLTGALSAFWHSNSPRSRSGGFARRMFPSLIDQGLTSLQSLLTAVVLIQLSGPVIFGQFVYIFSLVMIAASLQNGIIGIPALVHVASASGEARGTALSTLLVIDHRYRLVSSALIAAATIGVTADPFVQAVAGLFCYAHLGRETARNILFATGEGRRASLISGITFATFVPIFAVFIWAGHPLAAPFAATATGIVVALTFVRIPAITTEGRTASSGDLVRNYQTRFPGLGWRLAQCCSNEVQTRSHVFAVTALRGVDQVGLLEAGRVLWSPIVIVYQTWQKVAQPRLAELIEAGRTAAAIRFAFLSIAGLLVVSAIYAAALFGIWTPLSKALFSSFSDVRPFVVGWLLYTSVLLANWILIAFLNAQRRFRAIAVASLLSAGLTALLLLGLLLPVPLLSVVGILIAVQSSLFAILCVIARREAVSARSAGDLS